MSDRHYIPITDDIMHRVIHAINDVPKRNQSKFEIVSGEYYEGDYIGKLIVESMYASSAFRRYFRKSGIEGLRFECAYLVGATGCRWHIEFSVVKL